MTSTTVTSTTGTSTTRTRVKPRTALLAGGIVSVLAVIAVFPLVVTNALDTQFAVLTLMFVAAVAGWNLFSGYSGYISLGHAVFFGVGAYTVALLTEHWHLNGGQIFELIPLGNGATQPRSRIRQAFARRGPGSRGLPSDR